MPLLKWSVDLFPPNLLDLPGEEFPWSVAHVRSRQEKALARYLLPLDVPFYLPQRKRQVRRAGRTFVSFLPLFPGYVFFRGLDRQRRAALRSNLIVRVLNVRDQELLDQELVQIRRLQEAGVDLAPIVNYLPGDPVRITEGPFKGYTGVIGRFQGRSRLVISISILRQSVSVEFERDVVAPVRWDSANRQINQSAAVS